MERTWRGELAGFCIDRKLERKADGVQHVLVLNASYERLNVVSVRRAVRLVLRGKAEIVRAAAGAVRSVSVSMPLPRIIRLLSFVVRRRTVVAFSKRNVLRRDRYACQYCGRGERRLTIDHVVPRSAGGGDAWTNVVACCYACNQRKGSRSLADACMTLRSVPAAPSFVNWTAMVWSELARA